MLDHAEESNAIRLCDDTAGEVGDAQRLVARLALLAAAGLYQGAWAQVGPRSYFESFPDDMSWIAVDGPYNEHLVRDIGGLVNGLSLVAGLLPGRCRGHCWWPTPSAGGLRVAASRLPPRSAARRAGMQALPCSSWAVRWSCPCSDCSVLPGGRASCARRHAVIALPPALQTPTEGSTEKTRSAR
jgi:hypothetical protein